MRKAVSVAGLVLLIAVALVTGYVLLYYAGGEGLIRESKSVIGLTESQLIEKLGAPRETITRAEALSGAKEYPDPNFTPKPPHAIENKVLLYLQGVTLAYIYIGPDGTVSRVFIAQT